MLKWEEWLEDVRLQRKTFFDVIQEHYPKRINIEDGLRVFKEINDDLGLFFTFAKINGFIIDYEITVNPDMIYLNNNISFIEMYYQFKYFNEEKEECIYFDSMFFLTPQHIKRDAILNML